MIVNQLIDTTKTLYEKKNCLIKAGMKFNDTQASYSNEQSSYINYSGFNPFPSSGHLNREKDDGSGGSAQQSRCVRPTVCTVSAGRWARRSRVCIGDPRALRLLWVKLTSAVATSSSSLPAAMFRGTALLLAPCNHGVQACAGQDSTQSGPGWMEGGRERGVDSLLSHCEASAIAVPLGTASWPSTTKNVLAERHRPQSCLQ